MAPESVIRPEDEIDEPGVLGAGDGPPPLPTQAEGWAAWKRAYIARWVEKGFDEDWGESWFDTERHELSTDPAASADDDMEYLDDE